MLTLRLARPAAGVKIGVKGKALLSPGEYACDPCVAELPVEAEYAVEEVGADSTAPPVVPDAGAPPVSGTPARGRVRLSLEPTETGFARVLDGPIAPPRGVGLALAALGAAAELQAEARTGPVAVKDTTKPKAGGIRGALGRVARGDVAGAIASVRPNPQAVSAAVGAAKARVNAAKLSPPAEYRLKVRYAFEFFKPSNP